METIIAVLGALAVSLLAFFFGKSKREVKVIKPIEIETTKLSQDELDAIRQEIRAQTELLKKARENGELLDEVRSNNDHMSDKLNELDKFSKGE